MSGMLEPKEDNVILVFRMWVYLCYIFKKYIRNLINKIFKQALFYKVEKIEIWYYCVIVGIT